MNKHHTALELDKVLSRLGEFTSCEDAREQAENLIPESNMSLVQALINQTADAHMLMAKFGAPSFGGLKNVNNALSRANAGSVLNMRELLDIAEVLRVIRSLSQWKERNSGVTTSIDTLFYTLSPNKFLEDKKKEYLKVLEQADEGFETVYNRVKEELEHNKNAYETEIKTMQGLIKKITDYTVKIKAQEVRNKQMMELFFQQKKQEIRAYKNNQKTAKNYTNYMTNQVGGQSFFVDNKR